jgi:hypothetical protein
MNEIAGAIEALGGELDIRRNGRGRIVRTLWDRAREGLD